MTLGNFLFKLIGCVLAIPLLRHVDGWIDGLGLDPAREVVLFHFFFNVALSLPAAAMGTASLLTHPSLWFKGLGMATGMATTGWATGTFIRSLEFSEERVPKIPE